MAEPSGFRRYHVVATDSNQEGNWVNDAINCSTLPLAGLKMELECLQGSDSTWQVSTSAGEREDKAL